MLMQSCTWREAYSGMFYRKYGSCLLLNEVVQGSHYMPFIFTTYVTRDVLIVFIITFRTIDMQCMY